MKTRKTSISSESNFFLPLKSIWLIINFFWLMSSRLIYKREDIYLTLERRV